MSRYVDIPTFITCKDLAQLMGLSPDSVERWAKRLNVPPTVPGHASHRWSRDDAQILVSRWEAYWINKRKDPTYERRTAANTSNPTLKPTHPTPRTHRRAPRATHPTPSPTPRG